MKMITLENAQENDDVDDDIVPQMCIWIQIKIFLSSAQHWAKNHVPEPISIQKIGFGLDSILAKIFDGS